MSELVIEDDLTDFADFLL